MHIPAPSSDMPLARRVPEIRNHSSLINPRYQIRDRPNLEQTKPCLSKNHLTTTPLRRCKLFQISDSFFADFRGSVCRYFEDLSGKEIVKVQPSTYTCRLYSKEPAYTVSTLTVTCPLNLAVCSRWKRSMPFAYDRHRLLKKPISARLGGGGGDLDLKKQKGRLPPGEESNHERTCLTDYHSKTAFFKPTTMIHSGTLCIQRKVTKFPCFGVLVFRAQFQDFLSAFWRSSFAMQLALVSMITITPTLSLSVFSLQRTRLFPTCGELWRTCGELWLYFEMQRRLDLWSFSWSSRRSREAQKWA